ncbi:4-hydroxyacetophenone monooxygenase [Nannizzia gypsea CBS 118893]|uniref:4-hydroxyacetophenone monooxygenase n=1 Tax=Arthroderma gypseum (strain ATCC MYA-4604 / CBS 118893) TaxID=535722 RepID=E4UVR1_ARTGP|nr:4-hydroxyacetophenone monooxygenase [Nannizzia gypsea CBS 118893]EFR02388.1 4-hydroxyacetophenone monooxygenase [Nannizzia gypsea CBS 118893]
MVTKDSAHGSSYSQVACIGAGMSATALGVTLKRWYQIDDIRFFERRPAAGGTWEANTYPGCACDVPSALYSFSFALSPNWTELMPRSEEIREYHEGVADAYNIRDRVSLSTEVVKSVWQEDCSRWLLFLREANTGREFTHECQVLFSAIGLLVKPRECDIPGKESFKGHIFHSARWNHSVSLEGKNVIVIGNGCTATQIVPAIANKTKSLTQIVRSKHWIVPSINFKYPPYALWILRNIPFAMRLLRFLVYLGAESAFSMFYMTEKGKRLRQGKRTRTERFMRKRAPEKYHDILIPDFEIGCKRRIFDTGYLKALHNENLLLTDAKILKIVPDGLQTGDGFIPADVIVLATGFDTSEYLNGNINILGRGGKSVAEHWDEYGGPEAYNSSAMHGFPNFFMLLGPNTATGHTSALMAAENSVNYALRILKPVLMNNATSVEVKQEAESVYVNKVQAALQKTVFHSGCRSWYVNDKGWNGTTYPWPQSYFWYRSLFPCWSDWDIKVGPSTWLY